MNINSFKDGTYQVGKVVGAVSASYERAQTKPPSRYTESSLIDDMLSASKFAANDAERTVLKQISGLGTSRTRQPTITGLIDKGLMKTQRSKSGQRKVDEIVPTDIGRTIINYLPDMLTNVATTAKWESAFRMIEQGKTTGLAVKNVLATVLRQIVDKAKQTHNEIPAANKPR
jgi:DNA topoisomerase-3